MFDISITAVARIGKIAGFGNDKSGGSREEIPPHADQSVWVGKKQLKIIKASRSNPIH